MAISKTRVDLLINLTSTRVDFLVRRFGELKDFNASLRVISDDVSVNPVCHCEW